MTKGFSTRPLTLGDRDAIETLYQTYGRGDSAHAFPSLFLWQEDMGLSLYLTGNLYALWSEWKGMWFFPCGSDGAKADFLRRLPPGTGVCYLTEADRAFLDRTLPGTFTLAEAPGDSEYLYDRQEMIDLPGRRFAKLRNLYRRLEREHDLSIVPLTGETLPTVAAIAADWKGESTREGGVSGDRATALLLDHWTGLGASGVLLTLDGEPWAAAAGFPLGKDDFDCCFQKAKVNIPGVTEYLRAGLARLAPEEIRRFNYEEDLGLEGLRLMKTRLRPCAMITMYTGVKTG